MESYKMERITAYLGLLTVALIYFFIVSMWGQVLSTDIADWASFGSFIAPLISLATMIILIMTIQTNKQQEEEKLIIQKKEELGKAIIIMYQYLPVIFSQLLVLKDYKKQRDELTKDFKEQERRVDKLYPNLFDDYNDPLPIDMSNAEAERAYRTAIRSMTEYEKEIEKASLRIDEEDRSIEERIEFVFKAVSDIELIISLYMNNKKGVGIISYIEFSRVLLNNGEGLCETIKEYRTDMFADFKRKSIEIVIDLDNKMHNNLENYEFENILTSNIIALDDKYGLNIMMLLRQQQAET